MSLSAVGLLVVVLVPLAVLVGIVLVVVRLARRGPSGTARAGASATQTSGQAVRRFFQFLLLTGLLVAAGSGVAGLLGRLLDPGRVLVRDDGGLALQLTFTFIALPIWAALAWWTSRRLRTDPAESRSLGWAAYLTIVGIISLVVAMVAWQEVLDGALTATTYRGQRLATALVWTAVWGGHRWWGRSVTPRPLLRAELLLGSLVGLLTAAAGLLMVVSPALRELFGLTSDSIVGGSLPDILRGAATLVVGAVVWAVYWLREAVRGPRDTGWLALVLLAGVAGGLLVAVVAASVLGYDVLVWLVGDPATTRATLHFAALPGELATLLVGLLVWWYHSAVLEAGAERRTEVRRVYEYVLAAVGLLAASAGLVMVLVTIVEAIAAGSDLVVGGSALNALLAALVLLAVGLPLWWWHWRSAQRARAASPAEELESPTRRTYLLVLFGLAGVVAVVALLTLVYLLLQDALESGIDVETMRSIRFPFGILATTSLLSAYHWTVFRTDRAETERRRSSGAPAPGGAAGTTRLRHVLLVGAGDPGVAAEVSRQVGASVQVMRRTDLHANPWVVEQVVALLQDVPTSSAVVLADTDGIRVVPVETLDPYTG